MLICPVCQHPLTRDDRQLSCENRHSFDMAKQGYFNLLLNQAKKSKQPGDNGEMVIARTRFLNGGFYQSISDAINQMAIDMLWQEESADDQATDGNHILDLGCGEGYYTARLAQALSDHQIENTVYGLDISKDAVKAACKRDKSIHWLVANGTKAPFKANSMKLILNIFNRIMPATLKDLCHEQGKVLVASSGQYHLKELKEAIYDTPKFVEFDAISAMGEHFKHEHRQTLDFTVKLKPSDTKDLLYMTPHAWRSNPETQKALLSQEELELRIQVNLDCFAPIN